MPKRKRQSYGEDNGDRLLQMRREEAAEKLAESKKLLHRAVKTAKGFERQKLGKRIKIATANGLSEDIARINREIEMLKGLDLGMVVDSHLYKTLLKVKAIAGSELLPAEVKTVLPKPGGTEEEVLALRNVMSGMYNMKQVKDTMAKIMNEMYIALGIPNADGKTVKAGKKEQATGILKSSTPSESIQVQTTGIGSEETQNEVMADAEPAWEGFNSSDEVGDDTRPKEEEDLDSDDLENYDNLIGGSSDEESFDEGKYAIKRPATKPSLDDISLSSSPSPSPPPRRVAGKKASKGKEPPAKVGQSTFLPTLMGGYWSGSESSASDVDEDVMGGAPPIKKNRPGQAARRAIWEKKYGTGANHVKNGLGRVGRGKDDGWDGKRGAMESGDRGRSWGGGRGRGRGGSTSGRQRNYEKVTGENAIAVEPRKRGMGRKDDSGTLHPSWQAAKKAKEMKQTTTFLGKKVTFD